MARRPARRRSPKVRRNVKRNLRNVRRTTPPRTKSGRFRKRRRR